MSLTRTNWARSNTAGKFNTTEINTHQSWIDNKQIYRKVISLGTLPNATTKDVAHNIRSIDKVVRIYGWANNGTQTLALPASALDLSRRGAYLRADAGATDYSEYTESYAIMEYTKNE